MAVHFNGAAFRKASFNGAALRRIFFNGGLVWRSIPAFLYSAGDEAADETGGWSTGILWTGNIAQKLPDGIRLRGAGSGPGASGADNVAGAGFAYTAQPLDLTNISRLSMTVYGTLNAGRAILGVTDEPAVWAGMREPVWIKKQERNGVEQLNGTIELDVSAVTGRRHVMAAAAAQSYYEGWFADFVVAKIGCE